MGGKSKPPPAPDYSKVAAASEKSAQLAFQLGKEQLAWAKETYKADKEVTDKVSGVLLKTLESNAAAAEKDRARYESTFQPLEDQLARDAATYDTQERRETEAGRAQAEVGQQFNAAREAATRDLESYGINPSATRYAALDIGVRTSEAAAKAAAGTEAARRVEDTGRALRSEAINVGRGYPGQIAGTYGTSGSAGAGAANATLGATQTGNASRGTAVGFMGAGNQAIANWGNTLNMGYQNQLARYNAEQSSGLGALLGTAIGAGARLAFEKGGVVPVEASPSGGAIPDDVPIAAEANEFVVPREAVEWLGQKHFYQLVDKAKQERASAIPV